MTHLIYSNPIYRVNSIAVYEAPKAIAATSGVAYMVTSLDPDCDLLAGYDSLTIQTQSLIEAIRVANDCATHAALHESAILDADVIDAIGFRAMECWA